MMKTTAKGYLETDGKLKIACSFETKLFARIRAMAIKEKKSFGSMVEELCRVGILDLEESDAMEPHQHEARH